MAELTHRQKVGLTVDVSALGSRLLGWEIFVDEEVMHFDDVRVTQTPHDLHFLQLFLTVALGLGLGQRNTFNGEHLRVF